MARNGSGNYSLPSGNPVVPSTVISSTWANNTLSDIATALTQSIANDGQTTPVANLPMATFRHTNVSNALNRNEYSAAGQVQDGSLVWLTSVAGTNTITASITPSPTAYVAGQTFRFAAAGANTGAVTLNVNGLGAKAVTKRGTTALVAGDIPASSVIEVVYDGTQFQMLALPKGTFLGTQKFTASGTYTPTAGASVAVVEAIGGGGAGGGSPATAAGQIGIGSGGNSGAYGVALVSTGLTSTAVTIGAAGTGSVGLTGGAGGTTSFGAILVCAGGAGGLPAGPSTPNFVALPASNTNSVSGSGTLLVSARGNQGGSAVVVGLVASAFSGVGASSQFGAGGGVSSVSSTGIAPSANDFGSGGGGAFATPSQPAFAGGAGAGGLMLIHEYV